MSVVKSKQEIGELAVITAAAELAGYTVQICTNENNFPKRFRWAITNKIVDCAVDINIYLNAANSVYVEYPEDFRMRQSYQKKALATTHSLIATIKVAHRTFHIEASRRECWGRKIYKVQNLIRAWIRSDKERYIKELKAKGFDITG